jgi:hypothetical protein
LNTAVIIPCLKTSKFAPQATAFSVFMTHLHITMFPEQTMSSGPQKY